MSSLTTSKTPVNHGGTGSGRIAGWGLTVQMALLRVGIDSGSGGIQGPLFHDGTFEFIPIPDDAEVGKDTYGNTRGRYGRALVEYFPERRRATASQRPMHVDPEFETFTYGDPTKPKRGLRNLKKGDVLAFYAGLKGWDFHCPPALYIVGYFVVKAAGLASDFDPVKLREVFGSNFHVKHLSVFARDRKTLVLVKGGSGSRLLKYAHCISCVGHDCDGRPLKVLSKQAIGIFGDFGGRISIQRSPPRWVADEFVPRALKHLSALT